MRRLPGVREQHGFVGAERVEQMLVGCDERLLLLLHVELLLDRLRLDVFEAEPIQKRDPARAAFVGDAEFLLEWAPIWRVERGRVFVTRSTSTSSYALERWLALPPDSKRATSASLPST